ncbi:MAG: hydroxyacid dehydrogenase [Acidimicrobiia bacterium]
MIPAPHRIAIREEVMEREQMATGRPRVWFERSVLPALAQHVAARVTTLGPVTATPDDPHQELAGAQAIVASSDVYDASVMDKAPQLKVIARTGIGVDKVDLVAATARGIAVCNAPDGPTVSTAEHTVALILAVAKRIKSSEGELRAGGTDFYARHEGMELAGKTLGLVGCGRIGRRVARIADAMGMFILVHDPYVDAASLPDGVTQTATLEDLLAASHVVSIHMPLTDESTQLFDDSTFATMRPGALFVNAARGGIVDHDALLGALESGSLSGAALDVTDPEPLPPDHPLLHRPDVVVTAHIASATSDAKKRIFRSAFEQVIEVLDGVRPAHLVNPAVWGDS